MNSTESLKHKLQSLLQPAGIIINGPSPWDLQVHHEQFYSRVIAQGSMGLGEAYMEGLYDIVAPEEFFYRILRSGIGEHTKPADMIITYLRSIFINEQNKLSSRKVAEQHYNLSPELYMSFLDPYNQYTCCYFPDGNETLDEAAIKKLHLICRKLQLKATDRVLDIGCGWGGFAKFAAEHYGCHVTGISIAEEQIAYARNFTQGLPVTFMNCDYRDIQGCYDKVLVCGMIEHVGYKNYHTLMNIINRCMADNGLFLLQTIGRNDTATSGDKWIRKYIFPNSQLPSIQQLGAAVEGSFIMEDWQNMGIHYYHTLMAWHRNFIKNQPQLRRDRPEYDERFYRMWEYYLLSCAGAFKARSIQLWQIVYSKNGVENGYKPLR